MYIIFTSIDTHYIVFVIHNLEDLHSRRIQMFHTGRALAQAVRRYFLAAEGCVKSRIISRAIRGERGGSGAGFSPSLFGFFAASN
jgi:hypothetical protein